MINKAWQLGVIDYDLTDFKKCPAFYNVVQAERNNGKGLNDGDIVYIASTFNCPISSLDSNFTELKNINMFKYVGVTFANAWNVKTKQWSWIMLSFVKPILTEADVVEAELKFSIDLKEFI